MDPGAPLNPHHGIVTTTLPGTRRSCSACRACSACASSKRAPISGRNAPSCGKPGQAVDDARGPVGVVAQVLAGAHAHHRDRLDQHVVGGHAGRAPAGEAHHQQPAVRGDAVHGLVEHVTAHRVEHHVGAAPAAEGLDRVAKAAAGGQAQPGAQRLQRGQAFGRGAGGDDTCAQVAAQLHRGRAGAAAGTMHQQHLAGLQLAANHQGHPGGGRAHPPGRGLGRVEPHRPGPQCLHRHHHVLRHRAVLAAEAHALAQPHAADAGPQRADLARAFHAHHEGQGGLVLVAAAGHQQVGEVQRRGVHAQRHFARPRRGGGHGLQGHAGQPGRELVADQGLLRGRGCGSEGVRHPPEATRCPGRPRLGCCPRARGGRAAACRRWPAPATAACPRAT